jgi:hypothetical protein
MLMNKPNLDLRNLLGGTDRYLSSLACAMGSVCYTKYVVLKDVK